MADLCSSDRALRKEPEAAVRDRELLELAALAAGLVVVEERSGGLPWTVKRAGRSYQWNPLEDDGEALRLAVKLRLSVTHHNDISQPHPWLRVEDRQGNWTHAGPSSEFNAAPCAATRRAIVRAAAAIGSELRKAASGCSHTARSDGAKE